jgi:protoporphyrinogen/coproporphyrinogen III oxidase
VPGSLGGALRTPILSPFGKLRVLAEPVAGRRRAPQDESVHDFAARHFGQEFARVVAQTALLGVGAGDARQTGLRAVFPRLHALESTTGPLGLLGLVLKSGRGRGQGAVMATFRDGGLNVLPDRLATVLGGRVRLATEAREVRQGLRHRYEVVVDDGAVLEADTVIVAVPSHVAAALLRNLVPGAAARLSELPYTGVRVLGLGYETSQLTRPFGGFGFLVSPEEDLRVLAVVASSNLFPGQAPQGRILLRVFLGGWQEPELARCALPEALWVARDALRRTLGITGAPSFVADAPWPTGIPNYRTSHLAWLGDLGERLAGHPGLHLTGSAYRGLGIDDTIREAAALAARVIETDTARQEVST